MNVALIQPNSPFLMNERVFPNIGLVRVATQLKNDGHNVDVYDFSGKRPRINKEYDVMGFSSTTPQFQEVFNIHKTMKQLYPKTHTVIGGPHASAIYSIKEKGMKDINIDDLQSFDTIFSGEGELGNISKMFQRGWQHAHAIKNIDDVLIPNRSYIDIESYKFKLFGSKTTSIHTQRGCPNQCTFCCGRDIDMYKKVRMHSPERVVKEMDELNKEYGYKSFMFYDDEVNINNSRLEELCDRLSERDYTHRGFFTSDQMVKHPEQAEMLKKAGFVKLCSGVESGSDKMLKAIGKKTTYDINLEARKIVGKQGIHYESFLLLGHPDETMDDVNMTEKWLKEAKPDDFDLNVVTPYPGSKTYDEAIPSNKFKNYKWEFKGLFFNKPRYSAEDSYYKGIGRQSKSNVRTNELTNRKLIKLRDTIDYHDKS